MLKRSHGGAIVDLGNVIIAHWLTNISPENFHTIDYNSIPEVPGAFESLRALSLKFTGNITVVYNATNIAEQKIANWLEAHDFFNRTNISRKRVIRSRSGRDKTPYLQQENGVHQGTTIVIDDRLEVLSHFVGKAPNLFLFHPQPQEIEVFRETGALNHVKVVHSWSDILSARHSD